MPSFPPLFSASQRVRSGFGLLLLLALSSPGPLTAAAQTATPDTQPDAKPKGPFDGLAFRQIGPFRGGRVGAVTGVQSQPLTFYMGATGGGIWKTADGGMHWAPVADGQLKLGSVGAIAVADSNPHILYAGTGEADLRGNASHGRLIIN